MLENISEKTQLIITIIVLAVLFFAVVKNNTRNKEKRYDRKSRNFRKNFYDRRKQQNQTDKKRD
ncbi:hypothetical protein SAMN04488096_101368 [Mesonia phycicola]|uniref:Uncharacterized protein n=1 Tax=Mesonia phycicola TaxID=579105 RepID=A0A1M6ANS0_9FLAO|nr:hypothetical protein [Mesonia phycicola]SHI38159.1 hypothetical protein SAMN04488096_101368 [Mesonia phycicola]